MPLTIVSFAQSKTRFNVNYHLLHANCKLPLPLQTSFNLP